MFQEFTITSKLKVFLIQIIIDFSIVQNKFLNQSPSSNQINYQNFPQYSIRIKLKDRLQSPKFSFILEANNELQVINLSKLLLTTLIYIYYLIACYNKQRNLLSMLLQQTLSSINILNNPKTADAAHDSNFLKNIHTNTTQTSKTALNLKQSFAAPQDFIRTSKQTFTTLNSFTSDSQYDLPLHNQYSMLDFTFYPIQNGPSEKQHPTNKKSKLKFTHPSLHSVLLYALLFNHAHLSTLKEKLPKISLQSLRAYNLIKKYFNQTEHTRNIQNISLDGTSTHATFKIIEDRSTDVEEVQTQLKKMINKYDKRTILEMFALMLQHLKNQTTKDNNQFDRKNLVKDPIQPNEQRELKLFATLLGIRVKITDENKKQCFGDRDSYICVSIKRLQNQLFCLKKITCFEQDL